MSIILALCITALCSFHPQTDTIRVDLYSTTYPYGGKYIISVLITVPGDTVKPSEIIKVCDKKAVTTILSCRNKNK